MDLLFFKAEMMQELASYVFLCYFLCNALTIQKPFSNVNLLEWWHLKLWSGKTAVESFAIKSRYYSTWRPPLYLMYSSVRLMYNKAQEKLFAVFFSSALNEIGCTLILFAVSNSSLSRKRMNHFTPSPHVPWLLASVRACWLHFSSKKKKPKEQRSRAKCLVYVISLFLRLAVQLRHWLSFAR